MEDNKLDKTSTSSISTASTDISTEQKNNNKVSIDKLLNKKQQDQRTEKKQTPLEKYLADYEKTLENKSPEDLEKERNKLEQQKKMSLIASIIFSPVMRSPVFEMTAAIAHPDGILISPSLSMTSSPFPRRAERQFAALPGKSRKASTFAHKHTRK